VRKDRLEAFRHLARLLMMDQPAKFARLSGDICLVDTINRHRRSFQATITVTRMIASPAPMMSSPPGLASNPIHQKGGFVSVC
jgi:hypothetical protein